MLEWILRVRDNGEENRTLNWVRMKLLGWAHEKRLPFTVQLRELERALTAGLVCWLKPGQKGSPE